MDHSFKSRASMGPPSSMRKSLASGMMAGRKSIHGGMKKPSAASR